MQFSTEDSRVIREYAEHYGLNAIEYTGSGKYDSHCLGFTGRLGYIFRFYELLNNSSRIKEETLGEIRYMFMNWAGNCF